MSSNITTAVEVIMAMKSFGIYSGQADDLLAVTMVDQLADGEIISFAAGEDGNVAITFSVGATCDVDKLCKEVSGYGYTVTTSPADNGKTTISINLKKDNTVNTPVNTTSSASAALNVAGMKLSDMSADQLLELQQSALAATGQSVEASRLLNDALGKVDDATKNAITVTENAVTARENLMAALSGTKVGASNKADVKKAWYSTKPVKISGAVLAFGGVAAAGVLVARRLGYSIPLLDSKIEAGPLAGPTA